MDRASPATRRQDDSSTALLDPPVVGKGPALPPRPPKASVTNTSANGTSQNVAPSRPSLPPRPTLGKHTESKSTSSVSEVSPTFASSSTAVPSTSSSSAAGTSKSHVGNAQGSSLSSGFIPALPPRQASLPTGPVLDADEPADIQQVRRRIHEVRVSLIRAAMRLGYDTENALVHQVIYRLALAEKLKAPWRKSSRRPDPKAAAMREAMQLEQEAGGSSGEAGKPLGFCVKMMVVGLAGTGKTQLIHALIGPKDGNADSPASWPVVDPISGATNKPMVHKGEACGIPFEIMDTPGLQTAASATAKNQATLQQIKKAFNKFKPDLVVYVDRVDAGVNRSIGGGELHALQGLTNALGSTTWLNTIVALTHAGSPPPLGSDLVAWEQWAQKRSHTIQQVVRSASGDNRLMNPTAFVEAHPTARVHRGRDTSGVPNLYNGMAWRSHMLLMIVSAKLLADTENMLQFDGDGQPGAKNKSAAEQQFMINQMMGGSPRTLPLPYLLTQATQFSTPLKFPDHGQVMAVRKAEAAAAAATDPKQKKLLVRQVKQMKLQIKQAEQYKEKMARSFRMATLAGSKIVPEIPPLATKRPPSAHPACPHRYRVPEPAGGWVARPISEPHGMDTADGFEGFQMEQYSVVARNRGFRIRKKQSNRAKLKHSTGPADTSSRSQEEVNPEEKSGAAGVKLGGLPVHHYLSAQANKSQITVQGRTESTLYHDSLGKTTTALSADLQANGTGAGAPDALLTLRADVRRKQVPLLPGKFHNKATAGVIFSRLAEGGRLDKGPVAMGARLQHVMKPVLGGGVRKVKQSKDQKISGGLKLTPLPPTPRPEVPMEVSAALAILSAPWGSTSHATAASLAALGGGPPASVDPELALGANLQIQAEMQDYFGTRKSLPMTLGANVMSYKGDTMAGLAASVQVQGRRRDACTAQLQLSNKGKAKLRLQMRSGPWWWTGIVAMLVPLTSLVLEMTGLAV